MSDWFTLPSPLIIAHRGASADAPENTLAAFALAQEQGADGIELDVMLSADGLPVVIHDDTLDRTTTAQGPVAARTAAELADLHVPTLDDVFLAFGPSLLYNVELKLYSWRDRGLEAAVADRIAAYHLESRVLVSSFHPACLRRARQHMTRTIPLALLHHTRWLRVAHHLLAMEAVHPDYKLVDAAYMAWAKARGYQVNVWTVDDPTAARRMLDLGVHAIITNRPRFLRQQLKLDSR
ncbi:MAG: glycerophosphodiester phosphodiesterase family protein [Candidatus Promineifilaceae bacterium]